MGAVYSISGDLKYKSSNDIVAATKEFVNSYTGARFSDIDFNDLKGALECIFTKRGLGIKSSTDTETSFYSDFDASYGWESVMYAWFEYVAPKLIQGSELSVYPDSGHNTLTVNADGTVTYDGSDDEYYDDEDDEELEPYEPKDVSSITDPLEKSIAIIEEYLYDEFDHTDPIDRNKLDNIGLLFTTYDLKDDEDTDLQVSVDLVNNKMIYEIWGEYNTTETEQFDSIEDLCKYLEDTLSWDSLYSDIVDRIPSDLKEER